MSVRRGNKIPFDISTVPDEKLISKAEAAEALGMSNGSSLERHLKTFNVTHVDIIGGSRVYLAGDIRRVIATKKLVKEVKTQESADTLTLAALAAKIATLETRIGELEDLLLEHTAGAGQTTAAKPGQLFSLAESDS